MSTNKWMAAVVFSLSLLAGPLAAEEKATEPAAAAAAPAMSLEGQVQEQQKRIAELERMIKQQSLLLEQLQAQLTARSGESGRAEPNSAAKTPESELELARLSGELNAVAEHNVALQSKLNQLEKSNQESDKKLGDRLKGLGNLSFSGDVRVRYEPFFGGTLAQDRHRERIRLRFNAIAKFSDELTGGLTLASGDEIDPISTNQTLTGFFTRKAIGIDRAFVQYNPGWWKPLTLTGGKFAYTWYRTELTWDNDLNPEGFSEVLAFNFKDNPVFKKIVFVGFQLPFRETGAFDDSFVHGGQVQTFWKLGSRLRFSGYTAFYNWHRADPVRAAQGPVTIPVTGGACTADPGCTATLPGSAQLGGSTNTNTTAPGNRFASKFALLDVIGRLDFDTGSSRWPLMLQLDFVNNTRACDNVFVAACNSKDRSGWWAEVQVGQTKEPGDLNFGYTFIRLEREAVLAAFNFSDLRQPTNVVTHRLNTNYQLYKNVTVGYTLLVGRALQTATSPALEPWLKRMQFDLIYKF
jgi:hypothetical protein